MEPGSGESDLIGHDAERLKDATVDVDRGGKIFPLIKIVSREGITTLPEEKIAGVFKQKVA